MIRNRSVLALAAALAAVGVLAGCAEDGSGPRSLTDIHVLLSSTQLRAGDALQATVLADYDDRTVRDVTNEVTWASSDQSIVTVSEAGLIVGMGAGTATVSATWRAVTGELSLSVTSRSLESLAVSPNAIALQPGASQQFTAMAHYSDGTSMDVTTVAVWISSDEDIATVDAKGLGQAKSAGPASISAVLQGVTSPPASLEVLGVTLLGVRLDPPAGTLHAGATDTVQLAAIGQFDDGSEAYISKIVVWASSDDAVATVDAGGLVTAGSDAGTAAITAAIGTMESPPAIIVVLPSTHVQQVTVEPGAATIAAGTAQELAAIVLFADGMTADYTTQATWASSDVGVATVDAKGRVVGHARGDVVITAEVDRVFGHAELAVTNAALETIAVEPAGATLPMGTTRQLGATGHYSDGTTTDLTTDVLWRTSDESVLTVSGWGLATAVATGVVTVEAELHGVSGGTGVTVSPAVFDHIAIAPASPEALPVGLSVQLLAFGVRTDGTAVDLTAHPDLLWMTSAPEVATISNATGQEGTVTALSKGGVLLGARYLNGLVVLEAQPVLLGVVDAQLQAIEVTPTSPTLPAGFAMQLHATGLYSDGSLLNLTHDVEWSSSAPAIAAVANGDDVEGTVVALAAGAATIRATLGEVAGESAVLISATKLVSISVAPPALGVEVDATKQLMATGNFGDGTTLDLTTMATWSVAPDDLGRGVTVSNEPEREGLVTVSPLATPSAAPITIHATHGTVSGVSSLTIVGPTALTAIVVTVDPVVVPVGLTAQATATGLYADGAHPPVAKDITAQVIWSPSFGGVATVSNASMDKGVVTGAGPGTALIDACLGAICANDAASPGSAALVTVTGCAFGDVLVSPSGKSALELPKGTARAFLATATYDTAPVGCGSLPVAGYDVTELSLWVSSSPGVATVSNAVGSHGVVTASTDPTGPSTVISAHFAGLTGTASLAIIDACVATLAIEPAAVSLPAGVWQTFVATAHMTNESIIDYTDHAAWQVTGALELVEPGVVQTFAGEAGTVRASSTATPGCAAVTTGANVAIDDATLTSVTIAPRAATVAIGDGIGLEATGLYSDGTSFDLTNGATWTSSNPAVAVAQPGGIVTAKAAGTVVVLATHDGVSGMADLTIEGYALTGLTVGPAPDAVCGTFDGAGFAPGVRFPLRAVAHTTDGGAQDVTALVTWASDAPWIASIDDAGLVETQAPGDALIVATWGDDSGTYALGVVDAALTDLRIEPTDGFIIPVNATQQFRAFGTYEGFIDGAQRSDVCEITDMASWFAAPAASLVVSEAGLATSTDVATQSALVTATHDGVVGATHGEVRGACVELIRLSPDTATTMLGVLMQFEAEAVLSDGASFPLTGDATTWSSSDPAVAQVKGGQVVPLAPGIITVTATYDAGASACPMAAQTQVASAPLIVQPAALTSIGVACPESAKLWPGSAGLAPGLPAGLGMHCTALGHYTDLTSADVTASVTWTSSAPEVATVGDAAGTKGRVSALASGAATLDATLGDVTGSFALQVVGATVQNITVDGVAELPTGFTHPFTALAAYTLGVITHYYDVTPIADWSSSDPASVTVGNNAATGGIVTAVAPSAGPVLITASHMGHEGSSPLIALEVTLTDLELQPTTLALAVGQKKQVTATAHTLDAHGDAHTKDVTWQATWTTTDPAVATVGSGGHVTAVGLGSVSVIAELGAVSGSAPVAVEPRCIESLVVAPAITSLPAGVPLTFTVIATYTSGPSQDVTGEVEITSMDPARVPSPGADGRTATSAGAPTGVATILVRLDGGGCTGPLTTTAQVIITDAVLEFLSVLSDQPEVPVGLTTTFYAIGHYSDHGSFDVSSTVDAWATGEASVATVSNAAGAKGRVTGTGLGVTPVLATKGTVSGGAEVTVTSSTLTAVTVVGLDTVGACYPKQAHESWTAGEFAHPAGGLTTWVQAIGHFSSGLSADITDQVTWTSSNLARAHVGTGDTGPGQVTTGSETGAVTLTAQAAGGLTGAIVLRVQAGAVEELTLNAEGPDPVVLPLGYGTQLTATGRFADALFCVTQDATYASGNKAVATVTSTGWVDSRGLGFATITAELGGVNDTIQVQVNDAVLSVVETVPAEVTLFIDETAQIQAVAHFSDGTVNDVTYGANTAWSTSNSAIVGMAHAKGGVLALSPGTAWIDACVEGVCAADGLLATKVTVLAP